jgi:hypothetical protein
MTSLAAGADGEAARRFPPPTRAPDYRLYLQTREFVPEVGVSPELRATRPAGGRVHLVLQLWRIPDASEIRALADRGIALLDYLPDHAYFAAASRDGLDGLDALTIVRAALPVLPQDKLAASLRSRIAGSRVPDEGGTMRLLAVFFGDVPLDEVRAIAGRHGEMITLDPDDRTTSVSVRRDRIHDLAAEDEVQWLEAAPPPKRDFLDVVRATIHADTVQGAPYGLDGSGSVLGMWEGHSPAATHEDFAGRLVIADGATTGDHATMVAGCMAGDGARSEACGGTPRQWRGIATAAQIVSYSWPSSVANLRTETADAIATYGIMVTTNSWGWFLCGGYCSYFGDYDDYTRQYDRVVIGRQGAPISAVFGAGNERDCPECQDSLPNFPYGTLAGPGGPAKNSIAVGAVHAPDRSMTDFSGWGPVDDGRLKPDLVAPGCRGAVGITGPTPPNDYADGGCGTSYAIPIVTGSLGILAQQFDVLGRADPAPHTLKAVLIETAEDLGTPGPDYVFGHGIVDLHAAVDLVRADGVGTAQVEVDSVADGEVDARYMDVGPGAGTLRVTLVWDDFPGTPGAAKQLVNDLDLAVRGPGGAWHFPYLLDPEVPSADATTGINDVDNVEVVEVDDPEPGVWTVEVRGAIVPQGPQDYTVVLPVGPGLTGAGADRSSPPEVVRLSAAPNPFNPTVHVRFVLPAPGPARLTIYDTGGARVARLAEGFFSVGGHEVIWDGRDGSGREVSSGVYFVRLEAGRLRATSKVVLVR